MTAAVLATVVISFATACAPSAPTPTPIPEPTATPVEVLATKPEHLDGVWYNPESWRGAGVYYRYEAVGTLFWETALEELDASPRLRGRFWFEDGVYYQECDTCFPIGSYRAYLEIEGGRAVALRFEEIDDSDPSCADRRQRKKGTAVWVDR
jgi:hypothetical protein